jgi:hypothetical protein
MNTPYLCKHAETNFAAAASKALSINTLSTAESLLGSVSHRLPCHNVPAEANPQSKKDAKSVVERAIMNPWRSKRAIMVRIKSVRNHCFNFILLFLKYFFALAHPMLKPLTQSAQLSCGVAASRSQSAALWRCRLAQLYQGEINETDYSNHQAVQIGRRA